MEAAGSMHWRSGGGVVVEVDPGTPAPDLASHRRQVEVVGLQIVRRKRPPAGHGGVRAVRSVAPPMEWAGEMALAGAVTLHHLDASMPAGILEGGDAHVLAAHHHDGLVEDFVFGEIAWLRDLFEPARHLPDPRPQQFGLHLEKVGIEVALFGGPVRQLHRIGHRECRLSPVHDCHVAPFPLGMRPQNSILTGRYNLYRRPGNACCTCLRS